MIYEFNPDMPPDTDFVPGELKYLVPGNEARMLDPRRTPVRVVEIKLAPGFFVAQVLDFEDKGARWDLPLESVRSFHFARASAEAPASEIAAYSEVISRLDKPLVIPVDPSVRRDTEARIASLRSGAGAWLAAESKFLKSDAALDFSTRTGVPALDVSTRTSTSALDFSTRTGTPALWDDLQRYMTRNGLLDLEEAFAIQHVSNPHAGEMVKGHSIVLAELGLVPYDGKQIRDAATLAGPRDNSRRADHILHRLAFIREVFERTGHSAVVLYRGMSFTGPAPRRSNASLTSATFSLEVATSLFDNRDSARAGVLLRQSVPIARLFMTYLETEQMNRQYAEAEAILLGDPANELF